MLWPVVEVPETVRVNVEDFRLHAHAKPLAACSGKPPFPIRTGSALRMLFEDVRADLMRMSGLQMEEIQVGKGLFTELDRVGSALS